MKLWLLRLARLVVALAIVAVLIALFAGSEVVPAFVAYAALAALCLPGALLLRRRRMRPDSPRLDLTPRD
jgi:L-asparagine transporter-like permease